MCSGGFGINFSWSFHRRPILSGRVLHADRKEMHQLWTHSSLKSLICQCKSELWLIFSSSDPHIYSLELQMHPSPRIDPIPLLSSNLSGKRQIPWKQKSFFLLLLPPNPACLINIDSKVHLSHGQNITPTDYLLIAKGNIPLQWKDLLVTTLTTLTISTTRGKEHCAHLLTWHNLKCSIT